jgi:hypothetical protein
MHRKSGEMNYNIEMKAPYKIECNCASMPHCINSNQETSFMPYRPIFLTTVD